jgi:hypothetical protein
VSSRHPGRLLRQTAAFGLVFVGVSAFIFAPRSQDAPGANGERDCTVWTASAMERVGKADRPLRSTDVNIWAARGEYEPFQIVLTAGAEPVTGVDLEASDLIGPESNVIPAAMLSLYREHYVRVTSPSPDPGRGNRPLGKGWYPDALIPFVDPQ